MAVVRDLSPKEVAAACFVTEETVRRWCRSGLLGYQAFPGADWRIEVADLARFKAKRRRAG